MNLKMNDISISINIDKNGLYIFRVGSSTGKSYLSYMLNNMREVNKDIESITYDSDYSEEDYIRRMSDNCKLYLIDRFDLWMSKSIIKELTEVAKTSVILVDCKSVGHFLDILRSIDFTPFNRDYVYISFDEETMEVVL